MSADQLDAVLAMWDEENEDEDFDSGVSIVADSQRRERIPAEPLPAPTSPGASEANTLIESRPTHFAPLLIAAVVVVAAGAGALFFL